MAKDKRIEVILEMKNGQYISSVRQASGETQKFRKNVDQHSGAIASSFQKIYTAAKLYLGFKAAQYMLDLAGRFDDVRNSFESLTSSIEGGSKGLLKSIQTAAQGTVSQLEIMKSSNLAITLMGENVADYLPKMMEIARSTAATQGVSVAQMYNDIIVASGRQSVMILDNLGISSVTAGKYMEEYAGKLGKTRMQLNETEKRAAFFYAVMQAGGEIVAKTGNESLTLGQKIQVVKARAEDAATTLTEKLVPGLTSVLTVLNEPFDQEESIIGVVGNALNDLLVVIARFVQGLRNIPAAARQTWKDIKDIFSTDPASQYRASEMARMQKMSPSEVASYVKNNRRRLLEMGFNEDYLDAGVKMSTLEAGYSQYNAGSKSSVKRNKPVVNSASTEVAGDPAKAVQDRKQAEDYLNSFRQIGMSQLEIIQDNHEQEFSKLKSLYDQKLLTEEEYLSTREKLNKKYQDLINDYTVEKTQQWLSFGSSAIGEIMNLYNMSANNRIAKLDEQYAKEVEAINNSALTEEEKENKLAMLEARVEAEKKKIQIKNAKAQKKLALMQALVDVPAAVIATFRNMGGWPLGVVPAAIMGAIGAKKIQMIKDQPIPQLAEGGIAQAATMAVIGEGMFKEAVLPLSNKTFRELGASIEAARARNNGSSSVVQHYDNRVTVQGSIIDRDGFEKAVYEANRSVERRSGVSIYSRR